MPRRESPIEPAAGQLAEFALALRRARREAGQPSYAKMAQTAHYASSALSKAASGGKAPTWNCVRAFLQACNVTDGRLLDQWRQRWDALPPSAPDELGHVSELLVSTEPPNQNHQPKLDDRTDDVRNAAIGLLDPARLEAAAGPSGSAALPKTRDEPPLRVMVVARNGLMRLGLTTMLASTDDVTVVAEVESYEDVVARAQTTQPGAILLDPLLKDDLDVDAKIAALLPNCRRLWLVGPETAASVSAALGRMFDSAPPYSSRLGGIWKESDSSEIREFVRNPSLGRWMMNQSMRWAMAEMRVRNPLTAREQQILLQTAQGLPSHEVARALHLSPGTVRTCLSDVAIKLGARSSLHAVGIATQAGWIGPYSVLSIYD
ncbi:response regulator transcription factor [Kribbella sp. CA-293567]|uniref:response regulator transcription factor n=1 Tax=Kribbella sp. CA-293567 TaxID=3002436 RepID=UPI0022DD166E|nr:response regulator transcription factor [Kribbella sp. CA-293567]WBQ04440.1 response regulator transcription factor [Kribbella sp. CA-293567]